MTVRRWQGRAENTIVRVILARAGVAQPAAGLGAEEAGAGRRALGSAEQSMPTSSIQINYSE